VLLQQQRSQSPPVCRNRRGSQSPQLEQAAAFSFYRPALFQAADFTGWREPSCRQTDRRRATSVARVWLLRPHGSSQPAQQPWYQSTRLLFPGAHEPSQVAEEAADGQEGLYSFRVRSAELGSL
jgi:hypothetical protein